MSRLERTQREKQCPKKYKTVCRIIFLFLMLITTTSSILIIDYRINKILDDDSKHNLTEYIINIF